jgi:hypothetical protein
MGFSNLPVFCMRLAEDNVRRGGVLGEDSPRKSCDEPAAEVHSVPSAATWPRHLCRQLTAISRFMQATQSCLPLRCPSTASTEIRLWRSLTPSVAIVDLMASHPDRTKAWSANGHTHVSFEAIQPTLSIVGPHRVALAFVVNFASDTAGYATAWAPRVGGGQDHASTTSDHRLLAAKPAPACRKRASSPALQCWRLCPKRARCAWRTERPTEIERKFRTSSPSTMAVIFDSGRRCVSGLSVPSR